MKEEKRGAYQHNRNRNPQERQEVTAHEDRCTTYHAPLVALPGLRRPASRPRLLQVGVATESGLDEDGQPLVRPLDCIQRHEQQNPRHLGDGDFLFTEGWLSGQKHRTANPAGVMPCGFESRSLRNSLYHNRKRQPQPTTPTTTRRSQLARKITAAFIVIGIGAVMGPGLDYIVDNPRSETTNQVDVHPSFPAW